MVRLFKPLYLTAPLVGAVASIVAGAGTFIVWKENPIAGKVCLISAGVGFLYAGIITGVFYYKMWESIQDGRARMSPAKAVGFLFIPLFNLYWMFQVLWGFSEDYNDYIDRYAVRTRKLPEGLFLAVSILPLTTWIPFLNILTIVTYWIVFALVISQVCDAVNGLPAERNLPPRKASSLDASPVTGPLPHPVDAKRVVRTLQMYCLSGEFANEMLVIPPEGVTIGRDPARVNLVMAASEISGVHARVFPEPKSAQVWLEDMRSLNGTFYIPRGGEKAAWIKLQGKILLSPGARFRLALDGPEFEIRTS